jgi:nitrite reductase/ring-hydroxylating ferredoxin subunit
MAFIKVATVGDVPLGSARQVTVNGRTLALFHVGDRYYAIDDTCPHQGAPLSEGQMAGTEVVCPWHAARFDVATGAHLSPPARSGVATFPVQVVGDEIQVDIG